MSGCSGYSISSSDLGNLRHLYPQVKALNPGLADGLLAPVIARIEATDPDAERELRDIVLCFIAYSGKKTGLRCLDVDNEIKLAQVTERATAFVKRRA